MIQLTERSAKWMEGVLANFEKASGKPVAAWVKLAKAAGHGKDIKGARKWLKAEHGLTIVQINVVLQSLFPASEPPEDDLLEAQFSGPRAALRPIYDRLATYSKSLGEDVMIAPRKSQVTFARDVTFAVVRAATRDRVDLMLRLGAKKGTGRLVSNPKATSSDPTHAVALSSARDVDAEVKGWIKEAFDLAKR